MWLAEDPYEAIRCEVEHILQQQVPGSKLILLRVTSEPHWLTGAKPGAAGPNKALLIRAGVAFEFELAVNEPNGTAHTLRGVFSWVMVNLNGPADRKQRVWLDLDAGLATHGSQGELLNRLYST